MTFRPFVPDKFLLIFPVIWIVAPYRLGELLPLASEVLSSIIKTNKQTNKTPQNKCILTEMINIKIKKKQRKNLKNKWIVTKRIIRLCCSGFEFTAIMITPQTFTECTSDIYLTTVSFLYYPKVTSEDGVGFFCSWRTLETEAEAFPSPGNDSHTYISSKGKM